ncbi:MAG TPA: hypothetical protein VGD29_01385 [Actinoplanes sp.]|jgi:hypothetical protein
MGHLFHDSGDLIHTWSSEAEVSTGLLELVRVPRLGGQGWDASWTAPEDNLFGRPMHALAAHPVRVPFRPT